ncbi:hypothetical protein [Helicobacter gastrofelis]|nr:hypothetical protein [Helicobacter sp. NHP19-012]
MEFKHSFRGLRYHILASRVFEGLMRVLKVTDRTKLPHLLEMTMVF